MLITFTSKSAAEVLMYETHAKPILELLGKDVKRGVITAEETGEAIQRIEAEIVKRKQMQAAHSHTEDHEGDNDETDELSGNGISFGTRAFPLLEMLRAAHQEHQFVMWGV